MKKVLAISLFVFVLAVVFVSPVFAQGEVPTTPTSPVELPIELQGIVAAGIGFLVTAGLKSLSVLLNKDISGWGSVITGGLVTSVVFFMNAILSAVPEAAQASVSITLTLLVSVLSAYGIAATMKKFQPVAVKK